MSILKKITFTNTELKDIGMAENGVSNGRFLTFHFYQISYFEGKEIKRDGPLSVTCGPDADPQACFEMISAACVRDLGWVPFEADEIARAVALCTGTHTSAIKAQYATFMAEQAAKEAEKQAAQEKANEPA